MEINNENNGSETSKLNFEKILEESASCPICLKIADDAMESECCGQIFCNKCINKVESNICPICRRVNLKVHISLTMRKLIKNLSVKCIHGCGALETIENIKKHYVVCKNRDFTCKINKCGMIFKKSEFLCHVIDSHEDVIIGISENFEKIISPTLAKKLSDPNTLVDLNREDFKASDFLKFSGLKYSYFDEVVEFD